MIVLWFVALVVANIIKSTNKSNQLQVSKMNEICISDKFILCRVKRDGADCVLGAGNQIPAPRHYQDCPTELEFVD